MMRLISTVAVMALACLLSLPELATPVPGIVPPKPHGPKELVPEVRSCADGAEDTEIESGQYGYGGIALYYKRESPKIPCAVRISEDDRPWNKGDGEGLSPSTLYIIADERESDPKTLVRLQNASVINEYARRLDLAAYSNCAGTYVDLGSIITTAQGYQSIRICGQDVQKLFYLPASYGRRYAKMYPLKKRP